MSIIEEKKHNCKDIYDYALLVEESNIARGEYAITMSDEDLLINSLMRIMENEDEDYAIKILGVNPYLECLKYSNGFSLRDMEELYSIFDEVFPKYKNNKITKKIGFLEKILEGDYKATEKKFAYFISKKNNFSAKNIEIMREYETMMYNEEEDEY